MVQQPRAPRRHAEYKAMVSTLRVGTCMRHVSWCMHTGTRVLQTSVKHTQGVTCSTQYTIYMLNTHKAHVTYSGMCCTASTPASMPFCTHTYSHSHTHTPQGWHDVPCAWVWRGHASHLTWRFLRPVGCRVLVWRGHGSPEWMSFWPTGSIPLLKPQYTAGPRICQRMCHWRAGW